MRSRSRSGGMAHVASLCVLVFGLSLVALRPSTARAQMGGGAVHGMVMVDDLEVVLTTAEHPLSWDMLAWVGGDWNRLWIKSEGEALLGEPAVEGELQLLYSRLIDPYFELQVGVRGDLHAEPTGRAGRAHLTVGLEGLMPYFFEVELAAFVSHRGDVSGRFGISHDLFVTQRLIGETSLELNVAVQEVPEFGVGPGLNDFELGFRLRYEIIREVAPYVGLSWQQLFGRTAELARSAGRRPTELSIVAGLRLWI